MKLQINKIYKNNELEMKKIVQMISENENTQAPITEK